MFCLFWSNITMTPLLSSLHFALIPSQNIICVSEFPLKSISFYTTCVLWREMQRPIMSCMFLMVLKYHFSCKRKYQLMTVCCHLLTEFSHSHQQFCFHPALFFQFKGNCTLETDEISEGFIVLWHIASGNCFIQEGLGLTLMWLEKNNHKVDVFMLMNYVDMFTGTKQYSTDCVNWPTEKDDGDL